MWPFRRKEIALENPQQPKSVGIDANDLLTLLRAFESIGVKRIETDNKRQLAADAVVKLTQALEERAGGEIEFSASAMFVVISSNYLSARLGAEFESVVLLAFGLKFGLDGADNFEPTIEMYNLFTQARAPFISDLGNALAIWCARANEETFISLLRRFVALDAAFSEVERR